MIKVSRECEKAILALAPKHHACADAPNSITALRQWLGSHTLNKDSLPVYDGNCENTIFSSPEINIAFRAWHDALHLENNLGFKLEDECKIAALHCKELRLMGVSEDDIDLIFADVTGQVLYYYHTKEFISNQVNFHIALLNNCDIREFSN